jgi:putative transposase
MEWARILAYITGTVDQQLLLRNEYLVAENRILKAQLHGRMRLSDAERARLGELMGASAGPTGRRIKMDRRLFGF